MQPVNLLEYEEHARGLLAQEIFDFVAGGADDEVALRRNREAFQRIQFRPRVLIDVSKTDVTTSLLCQPSALPVLLAPGRFAASRAP